MKLDVPVYKLKRQARILAREADIPLHAALDQIAAKQGFKRWSLLAARLAAGNPAQHVLQELAPGELMLVAARPHQGKTLLCLELAVAALNAGRHSAFFSLEYTAADLSACLHELEQDPAEFQQRFGARFTFDCSDSISADYIAAALAEAPEETLVVIDYLQILDQQRRHPPLAEQMRALQTLARQRRLNMVVISQVDRRFDCAGGKPPGLADVRLPDPLDLSMFNRACFLHNGELNTMAVT